MFDVSIKRTPAHDGDGYSWGDDAVLIVGGLAVNYGRHGHREVEYLYKTWYDSGIMAGQISRLKKNSAEATVMIEDLLQDIDKERDFYKITAKLQEIKKKLEGYKD
ncbi:MAG: hypothetical protein ACK5XN_12945 [Bacteroidota bacterium]